MSFTQEILATKNIEEMLDQENKIILQLLIENKNIIQKDLTEEISPLLQHHWKTITKKLEFYGFKYAWSELRDKFKYWIKHGILDFENYNTVSKVFEENESEELDSIDSYSQLVQNITNSDCPNMPCTSTPKHSKNHTTNIVCNLTISPMSKIDKNKNNEQKATNKIDHTSMQNKVEDNSEAPLVYYINPSTCELTPMEKEEEALAIELLVENDHQAKRKKLEMSTFEKSIYEHQKKLFRQKLEQREKEHTIKMKLLEQQLKSGEQAHQLQMEISKLRRDILLHKAKVNDNSEEI